MSKKVKITSKGGIVHRDGWINSEVGEVQKALALEGKVVGGHGGYYGGGGDTRSYYKSCKHYGDEQIFAHGGRSFFGAKCWELKVDECEAELIIDCAGVTLPSVEPKKALVMHGPSGWKEKLNGLLLPPPPPPIIPPIVRLDWPDFKTPLPAGMKFWKGLWEMIPKGKIIICCQGGHGRTGTCAGSLMIAGTGVSGEEAIKHVRKVYCKEAIDNKAQEDYLVRLSAGELG